MWFSYLTFYNFSSDSWILRVQHVIETIRTIFAVSLTITVCQTFQNCHNVMETCLGLIQLAVYGWRSMKLIGQFSLLCLTRDSCAKFSRLRAWEFCNSGQFIEELATEIALKMRIGAIDQMLTGCRVWMKPYYAVGRQEDQFCSNIVPWKRVAISWSPSGKRMAITRVRITSKHSEMLYVMWIHAERTKLIA
jgi:hypothetical protein